MSKFQKFRKQLRRLWVIWLYRTIPYYGKGREQDPDIFNYAYERLKRRGKLPKDMD
jgi:hypothetical protein